MPTLPIARCVAKPPYSVPVPGATAKEGETIPRRHPSAVNELHARPDPSVSTTYDLVRYASGKFGDAKCIGSRKLVRAHSETRTVRKLVDGEEVDTEKSWVLFELGPYEYVSFKQYEAFTLQVGAGLRKLGLVAGDRVHIYAATSMHWLATSHGAASQSMPIVTAYDTLGEAGLKYSMVATNSKAVFLDPHLLPTLCNVLMEATEIKHVVWNNQYEAKESHISELKARFPYLTIMNFEELRKLGEENPCDAVPPKTDDLCCIMYTSGSTGTPKGVPLRHSNVMAAVAGAARTLEQYMAAGDSVLTYLPLAHILEFVFEHNALFCGWIMGYGNPKTLSDAAMRNCSGDIREFKPSMLAGVPAVFESVKKGIMGKVAAASPVARGMFWGAMSLKSTLMHHGLPGSGVLDAVVFKKIREATGGNLKLTAVGGGPISRDTQRFISMAIAPMMIGYGLTETTAMGTLMSPGQWNLNNIGAMPPCVEVKLVDFADAGYFVTNKPNPQGEVLMRGPSVMTGYYQNDAETQSAMTDDGWFRTGDIGEFDALGHLKLVDRKKNLVKTLNGEYIALEKLESVYRSHPLVMNLCVYADANKQKPVAVIVPAEPALKKFAEAHGIEGESVEELVRDQKLKRMVLQVLQRLGRESGLVGIEILEGIVLSDEEWTPQNGFVTAAQKLNRKQIVSHYKPGIAKAYGN